MFFSLSQQGSAFRCWTSGSNESAGSSNVGDPLNPFCDFSREAAPSCEPKSLPPPLMVWPRSLFFLQICCPQSSPLGKSFPPPAEAIQKMSPALFRAFFPQASRPSESRKRPAANMSQSPFPDNKPPLINLYFGLFIF